MPTTIDELLDNLRAESLDERDKGDKFERLIKAYLSTEPEWAARFERVWLWSEWPERGTRTDTGIDLVAERRDGEGLAATQCKFYAPGHKVAKSDIDSFISASARGEWTERYVFDTAAGWTNNAEETLEGVAQRVDIRMLDSVTVSGIPEIAYQYTLGNRCAIEWIIERYLVKTDPKFGIVNDPNDWSREIGDPRYILDLLARVVTVSVETMKIVDALPPLDVIESAATVRRDDER